MHKQNWIKRNWIREGYRDMSCTGTVLSKSQSMRPVSFGLFSFPSLSLSFHFLHRSASALWPRSLNRNRTSVILLSQVPPSHIYPASYIASKSQSRPKIPNSQNINPKSLTPQPHIYLNRNTFLLKTCNIIQKHDIPIKATLFETEILNPPPHTKTEIST